MTLNYYDNLVFRLNPFRTGQCLSTEKILKLLFKEKSLNPFRTGQCLSTAEGDIFLIIQ